MAMAQISLVHFIYMTDIGLEQLKMFILLPNIWKVSKGDVSYMYRHNRLTLNAATLHTIASVLPSILVPHPETLMFSQVY